MRALLAAAVLTAFPALAQDNTDPYAAHHMDMPGVAATIARMAEQATPPEPAPGMADMPAMDHAAHGAPAADAHAGHDMSAMPGMSGMDGMAHTGHAMPYSGVQAFYPVTRDASGTSWQPDASTNARLRGGWGGWNTTARAALNAVYDRQSGPRGDRKAFLAGMVMATARRDFENGDTVNLRAMLSPEPFMGPRGYPLLLAAGETADGKTQLVDRQHPRDLFMELSASYSRRLSPDDSLFAYVGLPGEPAFGPPAFMVRASSMDSPESPITHHWLDSAQITFGVVTLGWVHRDWKIEASRFKGREPDQHRYDIESPRLDSTAVRLSWNPARNWSLQGSWAELISPEVFQPAQNEHRWSASAIYTRPVFAEGQWSTTAAWGRKARTDGPWSTGFSLETALKPDRNWTAFARAERLETDELDPVAGQAHGELANVGKLSLGLIRDVRVANHAKVGLGGLYSFDVVPKGLQPAYGAAPHGAMAFMRLVID